MSKHVAVWLDHKEARVFAVHADKVDAEAITAPHHLHHKHPKGPEGVKDHPQDTTRFFREVASSIEDAEQILIVGPSTAKLEFLRYIEKHHHALSQKVVGLETVDHPTDGQLAAYAKTYFKRVERMQ